MESLAQVFKIDLKPSLRLYKIVYNAYNRPTIGLQFNEFQKSVSHFSTSPRPRIAVSLHNVWSKHPAPATGCKDIIGYLTVYITCYIACAWSGGAQPEEEEAHCPRRRHRLRERRRNRLRRRWCHGQGRFALDGVVMQTLLLSQSRCVLKMIGVLTAF